MFQQKIDKICNDMPNVFDIADDLLVAGYYTDWEWSWWHSSKGTTKMQGSQLKAR